MTVEDSFLAFTRENELIRKGDRVLLALSGGPDSVCLFHLLRTSRTRLQCRLFAAHLDHGIRPDSSHDRDFCLELCRKHRVEIAVGAAGLGPGATEAAARAARYGFLGEAAERFSCHVIATGHHRDDQAETIFLRLVRGTGLQGLGGILPARDFHTGRRKMRLVRPLLKVARADIEAFISAHGHRCVRDASNRDTGYRRNLVRREILPAISRLNPAFPENLARLAEILAADYRFIAAEARDHLEKQALYDRPAARERRPAAYRFSRRAFARTPLSLQREILRQGIAGLAGAHYRVDFNRLEKTRRDCLAGRRRPVPPCRGIIIAQEGDRLEIRPDSDSRSGNG